MAGERVTSRITLEFDPGQEPISGRVLDRNEQGQPFSGWMGLVAALQEALGGDRKPARRGAEEPQA
jgi:hypothetical protein